MTMTDKDAADFPHWQEADLLSAMRDALSARDTWVEKAHAQKILLDDARQACAKLIAERVRIVVALGLTAKATEAVTLDAIANLRIAAGLRLLASHFARPTALDIDRTTAFVARRGDSPEVPLETPRCETQATITHWADETFGTPETNVRVAARANEEMAELLRALSLYDKHPKAAEEIADVVIVLYRLAARLGAVLHDEVDRKMAKNRARTWALDGTGNGYHVHHKDETP
jgi:NTP pyrophosphatase (non-canonical NTP hydrolase)